MICYHHNDLDGRCAGAIVLRKYPACRMKEIDYKDYPVFVEEVGHSEPVIIVDFSFPPKKMSELFVVTKAVTWIDHHETAKDYAYEFPGPDLPGLRDFSQECKKSGCELTWDYLFLNIPIPEAVRLLGDYDCWRFDTEEQTNLFQQGMKLKDNNPKSHLWKILLSDELLAKPCIVDIVTAGAFAIRYRDNFCESFRNSYGWHLVWEGYKCYAMNLYMVGSQGFGDLFEKSEVDILLSFVYQEGRWQVSMYSKDIHVGEVAKKYGGGGHKGAAGFVCKELPF